MSKIVYAVFTNETIWRVFDTFLSQFMSQRIDNFQSYKYFDRSWQERAKQSLEHDHIKLMNTVIDKFSDDFRDHAGQKKDFISGIILRYWISNLDIDTHPYIYKLEAKKALSTKEKNSRDLIDTQVKELISTLEKCWDDEQEFYGGAKSTFTYAWKPSQICITPNVLTHKGIQPLNPKSKP
jgi:hypothetical protein